VATPFAMMRRRAPGAQPHPVQVRQDVERGVDGQSDHDHVADRADAGTLPQRHPQQ